MYVRYIAHSKGKYMAVRSRIFHLPPLFPVNPAATATPKNVVGFQQKMFSFVSLNSWPVPTRWWLVNFVHFSFLLSVLSKAIIIFWNWGIPNMKCTLFRRIWWKNRKRKKYFCYHHHQLIKRNHCSTFLPHSATFSSYFCSFAVQEILAVLKNLANY